MKILVPIKRVIDPYIAIRIDKDELHVVSENTPHAMNPFDETALSEAAALKSALPELEIEIIVVSIGPAATKETLRTALAMGADRAIHILGEQPLEPLAIAKLLKILVDEIKPDLVLMGRQSVDAGNGQTGPMLAGLLDWPQACNASKILLDAQQVPDEGFGKGVSGLTGHKFLSKQDARQLLGTEVDKADSKRQGLITRETDSGKTYHIFALPALITCHPKLNEPCPLGLATIMRAKRQTIEQRPISDFPLDLIPRLQVLRTYQPAAGQDCQFLDDPAQILPLLQRTRL